MATPQSAKGKDVSTVGEPLLDDNPDRFCMFPIKYPVSHCGSQQSSRPLGCSCAPTETAAAHSTLARSACCGSQGTAVMRCCMCQCFHDINLTMQVIWEMYKKAEASFWTGERDEQWRFRLVCHAGEATIAAQWLNGSIS